MSLEDDVLLAALEELGLLADSDLAAARARASETNRTLRETLVGDGVLASDQLETALRYASSRPAADLSGQFGKYRLIRRIGRGGMGTVYEAEDTRLGRTVALKVMRDTADADPDQVARFEREARMAARVRDPAVVVVHEAGVEQGRPFIAMEYIHGTTLDRIISAAAGRTTPIAPAPRSLATDLRSRVDIVRRAADAVHAAHRLGVIHRDLKPSNILIDAQGAPHVADFGTARELAAARKLTADGSVVGTPAYMAPEQARGDEQIDARTDVYALGVILYEVLTGSPPFAAPSIPALLKKIVEDEPPHPSRQAPGTPVELATVALKAMAKVPRDRYHSARHFAEDLRRWLAGEPIVGRETGRVRHLARRLRRFSALIASVLTGAAILTAVALFSWTRPARFTFQIEPPGADVEVDGRAVRSPATLAPGHHRVCVRLDGHRTVEEDVVLVRGETVERRYALARSSGMLAVSPRPDGLTMHLRGPAMTITVQTPWGPTAVAPGRYTVTLWGAGRVRMQLTFDLADGETRTVDQEVPSAVRWQRTLEQLDETPALADLDGDRIPDVIVPADTSKLHALSGATGRTIWEADIGSRSATDPALADINGDGVPDVLIGQRHGMLYAFNGRDGATLMALREEALTMPAAGFTDITGDGRPEVLATDVHGRLRCFDASTSRAVWSVDHGDTCDQPPVYADVNGDGRSEIVMATSGVVCVHEPASGVSRASLAVPQEPASPLLVADADGSGRPSVIVGCADGTVVCLDMSEPRVRWSFRAGPAVVARPMVGDVDGDAAPDVVVVSEDANVYVLDGRDGREKWRYRTGSEIHSAPAIGDVDGDGKPEVVVGSDDRSVAVLEGHTGRLLWSYVTGNDVDSAIRLLDIDRDGCLEIIVCSNDGTVTCLGMVRPR